MDLEQTLSAVREASRHLLAVDGAKINEILCAVADAAVDGDCATGMDVSASRYRFHIDFTRAAVFPD